MWSACAPWRSCSAYPRNFRHASEAFELTNLRKITESVRSEPAFGAERPTTLDDDDLVQLTNEYRAGEVIGDKYRLIKLLGEGGMGAVWLALNVALDSEVAIKLLRAGEKSIHHEQRLLKEARAVARLGHPAIVRVFDFGVTRIGDPYIVMELLDGEDLSQTLAKRGRLTAIKAVRTLLPVLHALGTAHQKGIVHRDLKPENIFLTHSDNGHVQPKLVDFGIVKTGQPEADRLTRLGTVLGTPAYLSPEQARGEDVDHRTDIWSSAVVLYEMVTGRLPFEGPNYNALMRSIIEDIPPPVMSFAAGDERLWTIINKGLVKRSAERWQSMDAFGAALAGWLLEGGETDDISGASLRGAWYQNSAVKHDDLYSIGPQRHAHLRVSASAATLVPNQVQGVVERAPRKLSPLIMAAVAATLALSAGTWAFLRSSAEEPAVSPMSVAAAVPEKSKPATPPEVRVVTPTPSTTDSVSDASVVDAQDTEVQPKLRTSAKGESSASVRPASVRRAVQRPSAKAANDELKTSF